MNEQTQTAPAPQVAPWLHPECCKGFDVALGQLADLKVAIPELAQALERIAHLHGLQSSEVNALIPEKAVADAILADIAAAHAAICRHQRLHHAVGQAVRREHNPHHR
jgi:hypothetical protein